MPTDKKFTGQRLDGTGLYYYNARYYDPLIGRFISPDTIIASPANPQTLNRYSYSLNNPLKYVDPSGHTVEINGWDVRAIQFFSGVGAGLMYFSGDLVNSVTDVVSSPLYQAYEMFKGAAQNIAIEMENATNSVFNLKWINENQGTTSGNHSVNNVDYYDVGIPASYKKHVPGAAVLIAHEFTHCEVALQFGSNSISGGSRYEEAVANQFMGWVANKIGYSPSRNFFNLSGSYWLIRYNIAVANGCALNRGYNDWILGMELWVAFPLTSPTFPTNPDTFSFLQSKFDFATTFIMN